MGSVDTVSESFQFLILANLPAELEEIHSQLCLSCVTSKPQGFEVEHFPDIWFSQEVVHEGIERSRKLYEDALPNLQSHLGEFHGNSFDLKAAEILVGPWLLAYIHQLVAKVMTLEKITREKSELRSFLIDPADHYIPSDVSDFYSLSVSHDGFQWQLWSEVLRYFQIEGNPLSSDILPRREGSFTSGFSKIGWKQRIEDWISEISHQIYGDRRIRIVEPYLEKKELYSRIRLILLSRFQVCFQNFQYPFELKMEADPKRREGGEFELGNSPEGKILSRGLLKNIPLLYLEGYSSFSDIVSKVLPRVPKILFSANALHINPWFQFAMALKAPQVKLLYQQHGAGYGMDDNHVLEEHERSVSATYFTAGWGERAGCANLSIPKFQSLDSEQSQGLKRPLFSINAYARFVYRIHFQPMGSSFIEISHQNALQFLKSLPFQKEILIRIHPKDSSGWGLEERLKNEGLECDFDPGSLSFKERLNSTSLYLSNHLGTSFLETMAANLPSVIFLDHRIYSFREHCEELIKPLEKAGVIFWDPLQASAHVEKVGMNPGNWWEQEPLQRARREFVSQYCAQTGDWVWNWLESFQKELEDLD